MKDVFIPGRSIGRNGSAVLGKGLLLGFVMLFACITMPALLTNHTVLGAFTVILMAAFSVSLMRKEPRSRTPKGVHLDRFGNFLLVMGAGSVIVLVFLTGLRFEEVGSLRTWTVSAISVLLAGAAIKVRKIFPIFFN